MEPRPLEEALGLPKGSFAAHLAEQNAKEQAERPSDAAAGSRLSPVAPNSKSAVLADDLLPALKMLKPGETIECHHPEGSGAPTNTGVVVCKNEQGQDMHIHVGLWSRIGQTLVWTYCCLSA